MISGHFKQLFLFNTIGHKVWGHKAQSGFGRGLFKLEAGFRTANQDGCVVPQFSTKLASVVTDHSPQTIDIFTSKTRDTEHVAFEKM